MKHGIRVGLGCHLQCLNAVYRTVQDVPQGLRERFVGNLSRQHGAQYLKDTVDCRWRAPQIWHWLCRYSLQLCCIHEEPWWVCWCLQSVRFLPMRWNLWTEKLQMQFLKWLVTTSLRLCQDYWLVLPSLTACFISQRHWQLRPLRNDVVKRLTQCIQPNFSKCYHCKGERFDLKKQGHAAHFCAYPYGSGQRPVTGHVYHKSCTACSSLHTINGYKAEGEGDELLYDSENKHPDWFYWSRETVFERRLFKEFDKFFPPYACRILTSLQSLQPQMGSV